MALYMTVVMGGTPLGSPVIGWIGEHLGARWTLIIGGLLVLVGVGAALVVFRLANRRQNLQVRPAAEPALGVLTP
jgi:MFS family permease